MTIINPDGRVFGRINLFDAAVLAFAVLLLPLAYVSFLLFRTAPTRITSVEPAPLTFIEDRAAGGSELRGKLKIHGTGLRPVLRAMIGAKAAIAYIFENPTSADVLYGALEPGSYDLVLYDGVQEVARAANALKIAAPAPPPSTPVRLVGRLIDLDETAARALRVGATYPAAGPPRSQIVALGDIRPDVREVRVSRGTLDLAAAGRWQRDAAIAVDCALSGPFNCRIDDIPITTDGSVIEVPGSSGALRLSVVEFVPAAAPTPVSVRVRFLTPAEAAPLLQIGDVDQSAPPLDDRAATIVSIERREIVAGALTLAAAPDGTVASATLGAADRVGAIDALLRLGADATGDSLSYRLQPLAVGRSIAFVTPRYTVRGLVRSIAPIHAAADERR
jgi:hypothetical protein